METSIERNPYYIEAMDFIRTHDLSLLAAGRYAINGDNLYLNIVDAQMRPSVEARLEVHDRYIDVQVPLSCQETFGIKSRAECTEPDGSMDTEKDIMFFNDVIDTFVNVRPGEVMVFPPDTAHAPLIGEGHIRKAIFKVRVC
ncbi:MAG: YhcH/YjgK/YiaL family protein [Bacteroidetes bacterium]|uniref:YhcH/YjgK/YiaL family protein n=1 Tax=Candidatus Cryptobacteroides excrementavium TaxID=2840759 RepID=A0A9D9NSU1_9BACT|nr:YhcH/YjgK/YiaL family protein [Candidatus Cryptobacteroides excrementavium]